MQLYSCPRTMLIKAWRNWFGQCFEHWHSHNLLWDKYQEARLFFGGGRVCPLYCTKRTSGSVRRSVDTDRYFLFSYFFFTAMSCLFEAQIAGPLTFCATWVMHLHNSFSSKLVYSNKIGGWQKWKMKITCKQTLTTIEKTSRNEHRRLPTLEAPGTNPPRQHGCQGCWGPVWQPKR